MTTLRKLEQFDVSQNDADLQTSPPQINLAPLTQAAYLGQDSTGAFWFNGTKITGGGGTTLTGTGLARQTGVCTELSGDVTTAGSNVATVVQVNSAAIPVSKAIVGTNGFGQIVDATATTLPTAMFPALTGDITTTAGSLATTLKNTGTPGTYPKVTTDAQGRVTSGTTLASSDIPVPLTISDTAANADFIEVNTTVASGVTTNASPTLNLKANYWTGAASALDTWTIGTSLAAGTNGQSVLAFTHSGSTNSTINFPAGSATNPAFGFTGLNDGFYGVAGAIWATNRTNATLGILLAASGVNSGVKLLSGAGFNWSSSASDATQAADTGITRIAAASVAIGNGTAANTSGALSLTTLNVIASASAPTSAGTAGTAGQVIMNGGNLYLCSVTGAAGSATWNKLSMTAV